MLTATAPAQWCARCSAAEARCIQLLIVQLPLTFPPLPGCVAVVCPARSCPCQPRVLVVLGTHACHGPLLSQQGYLGHVCMLDTIQHPQLARAAPCCRACKQLAALLLLLVPAAPAGASCSCRCCCCNCGCCCCCRSLLLLLRLLHCHRAACVPANTHPGTSPPPQQPYRPSLLALSSAASVSVCPTLKCLTRNLSPPTPHLEHPTHYMQRSKLLLPACLPAAR